MLPRSAPAPRSRSRSPLGEASRRECSCSRTIAPAATRSWPQGGYVTGALPPSLENATDTQIAEAVRIGPYVMPRFSERAISNSQLDSIIAWVDYTKHPDNSGGWALGTVGPVPEGLVTWGIAIVVLVVFCMLIGERLKRHA